MRWITELGRVDILTNISKFLAQNALPQEGHLEAIYHIISYQNSHEISQLFFPVYPEIIEN